MHESRPLPPLVIALALLCGSGIAAAAGAPAAAVPVPLERIHADPPLEGSVPRAARLSPGGRFVSYLAPSAADSEVLELWLRPLPDGQPRRLASAEDLLGTRTAEPTEAEKMALERRRILQRGITDYGWCGEHDTRIVVALGGALHVVDIDDGAPARFRRLPSDGDAEAGREPAREPKCDRSGEQTAFVRHNDLWVQRLDDGGAARRLTGSGSGTVSTGLADFIAAEEFKRFDGFWWSRDGRRLLALEVDDSGVALKSRMKIRAEGSDMAQQRYPAAGGRNARVQALAIDVASGRTDRLALPPAAEYTVRAGWFADGTPWLQWMTRDQTELHLVEYPDTAAAPRSLLVEREATWVDVHDDLLELDGWPLSGRPSLLWSSERSGRRQLWQLDRVGGGLRQLTSEAEPVAEVVCANAQRIVFAGKRRRGREQALFTLDRAGRVAAVEPDAAAARWRTATADTGCERLLVRESDWSHPPRFSLLSSTPGGWQQAPLALGGTKPDPVLPAIVPPVQVLDLPAADGVTPLNAFYLPPLRQAAATGAPGASAKHAVITAVYGGPGISQVGWFWHRQALLYAHWQRLGFGVLLVDTRGAAGRDRDVSHAHFRRFGKVEVADLFAAVTALPRLVDGVDAQRIGVVGWSYGGYLAARAVLDEATPFAAAVAGAPVVDWTLYDTAYTERYLGLPEGGAAPAYRDANLALRAARLARPLMLLHGTSDDNVLFEHSLRLMQALQAEGKLFETVIYPGQTHGLGSRRLRLHADRATTDFFVRQLRP